MPRLALVLLALLLFPAGAGAQAPTSCEEGPRVVGNVVYGTPCADTIRMPRSVTVARGEGGDDTIYGQRGNDRLFGGPGNDRLYGGVGDDMLRGGPDDDLLSGGFGADSLDGEAGDDLARGDATIDAISDSGGGQDTLSYATGATPGFFDRPGSSDFEGLPVGRDGRGAYIDLGGGLGDNGLAPAGGGVDEGLEGTSFEVVIGTAFADYVVGTGAAETFYGGGGADVILGNGGDDEIHGGAEGDYCEAAAGSVIAECELEGADQRVAPRDPGAVAGGAMAPGSGRPAALYLTGSDEDDEIAASYAQGAVTFALGPGSGAELDPALAEAGGCDAPSETTLVCPIAAPPDSVLVAGEGGDDDIVATGFPPTTSIVLLGGEGDDDLTGGATEDAVVDGPGDDIVAAGGGDDAVPNNQGADELHAGAGEDLFISDAVCEGDLIDGGPDRDNANWANFGEAISIDMAAKAAGRIGDAGEPSCEAGEDLSTLIAIEDVESTRYDDVLIGDAGPNQLLGRLGADSYSAGAGNDVILANSALPANPGDSDPLIECGEGWDTALVDIPTAWTLDAEPLGCEDVEQRAPNSFRPPGTPPDPNPPPPVPAPPTTAPLGPAALAPRAPRTRIVSRPPATVWTARQTRQVGFRFRADQRGARFRCRLDRGPFRPCRSPRRYRLAPGRHVFAVYAIDRAGSRDPTPAKARFRVSAR